MISVMSLCSPYIEAKCKLNVTLKKNHCAVEIPLSGRLQHILQEPLECFGVSAGSLECRAPTVCKMAQHLR